MVSDCLSELCSKILTLPSSLGFGGSIPLHAVFIYIKQLVFDLINFCQVIRNSRYLFIIVVVLL